MATITIIGAGLMGTALAWPATDNGHRVRLVGTPLDDAIIESVSSRRVHPTLQREVPAGVEALPASAIPDAVVGSDLVINGVSSFGIPWFAQVAGPHLRPEIPVLSVTKGLEDGPEGELTILPEAIDRGLPPDLRGRISLNAIGGPCTAHELAARRQTGVVYTGHDEGVLRAIRALLATPYYHPWISTDVVGVEVCAALKNAYALGVSLAVGQMEQLGRDGLALAYNPQAALFGQACREMASLVTRLGGDPAHVAGLPGAGDLYVTIFGGRTVRLGSLLGQGVPFAEARAALAGVTLESVEIASRVARALRRLEARGEARLADYPLLAHVDEIINGGAPVAIPWEAFFGGAPA